MSPKARHKARQLALQAIYQWQLTSYKPEVIMNQLAEHNELKGVDKDYFEELVKGAIEHIVELDDQFSVYCDRAIHELNPIELAVLRLATYELLYRLDVPYKVVINEALEVTKIYGSIEGFKYVNGVLDKVAKQIRSDKEKL